MLIAIRSHFSSRNFWRNLSLSMAAALAAGHLVVSHDQRYSLPELLSMPRYYYSVALNGAAALLLIEFVHMVSRRLYRRFRAQGLGLRWLAMQALLGLGLTVVLELVMATLLFHYHGHWITETIFFRKLFVPITMFILIINLFFIVYYLYREPAVTTQVRYKLARPLQSGPCAAEKVLGMPALLYVQQRCCWSVSFEGEKLRWPDPLDASEKRLAAADYFRGQRDWLLHRSAVVSVRQLSGRRLELRTSVAQFPLLVVSRRRAALFKQWWSGDIGP